MGRDRLIRVLHVDDDPSVGDVVAEFLRRADDRITVATATSADEGLDRLATDDIDCVVSDYDMPRMDGLAFLERVRDDYGELPFILFTGKGSEEIASRAISAGVTDYLQKDRGTEQYRVLANKVANAVESRRAQAAAEHNRERLRSLSEAFPDVTFVVDDRGEYREVVTGSRESLLYAEAEELVGSRFHEVLPERVADRLQGAVDRTIRTGESQQVDYRLDVAAGTRWFEARTVPLSTTAIDRPTVLLVARDITDRKAREEELQQSQRLLDALSETLPTYAFVYDRAGTYLEAIVGHRWSDLYSREDLLGQTVHDILSPSTADRLLDTIRDALDSEGITTVEYSVEKPDETAWYVGRAAEIPGGYDGKPAVVLSAVDITDRRARERELERQNERLAEFASIVSHDLRNPLSVANGRLTLAREECDSDHLDDVARALDRMDELVADLLTLSRNGQQVGEMQSVALDAVVEDCWTSVSTSKATLTVETDRTVVADRSRLEQLLENLVRNGIEHGGQRGAGDGDLTDDTDVAITVGALDDEQGFYVADDGPGIPPEARDRVFDTDYSKSEDGTGLGLSIVAAIADAHGWDMRIRESDAGGARFEFTGVEFAD